MGIGAAYLKVAKFENLNLQYITILIVFHILRLFSHETATLVSRNCEIKYMLA